VSLLQAKTNGTFPEITAFDFRDVSINAAQWIAYPPKEDSDRGDLFIDYPFAGPWTELSGNKYFTEFAKNTKHQLDQHIEAIILAAENVGVDESRVRWAITELITNATQYGAISKTNPHATLIRVEWQATKEADQAHLAVAVSNPCQALFDPTRYARMEFSEFNSLTLDQTNAHLGTITLIGYLKKGTKMFYLWEMNSGERVRLSIERINDDDAHLPSNYQDLMAPIRVEATRFSKANQPIAYNFDQFLNDVAQADGTESLTISCLIS
jgi:hypothetical protein